MGIKLGNTSVGSLYLGSTKIISAYLGSTKVYQAAPVQLPAYTLRFRFYNTSLDPSTISYRGTWTQVSGSAHNDWDWTYVSQYWTHGPFGDATRSSLGNKYCTGLYDIIAAGDNSGVTTVGNFFGIGYADINAMITINYVTKPIEEWMSSSGPVNVCDLNVRTGSMYDICCCCATLNYFERINLPSSMTTSLLPHGFYNCLSLRSVPEFDGHGYMYTDASCSMERTFYGCDSLEDISNIGTIDIEWTNQSSSLRGLDFSEATFGGISDPLFAITGNEFANVNTPVKALGNTSYGTTLFDDSDLPTGWINILKWPLHASSVVVGIANGRSLTSIPQIPSGITSSGFGIDAFFANNPDVSTGMLAAYNALSAITPNGSRCFTGTGTNTVQGMADRAQIPQSWGGDYVVQDLYVGTSWSKSSSFSVGTTWSFTSNVDFSTLTSMQVYTESSISQYAGVNMKKSNIKTRVGSFSNGSVATYYWPAFVQFNNNSISSGIAWGLFPTSCNGTLTSSQSSGDMPGTLSYSNYGNHSVQLGTYSSSLNVVFCIIVTNTSTLDSTSLSNYGVLWNSYFYNDPVLRAVTGTVTPQSAIITV